LHEERLEAVARALRDSGATSVLDLGCGPGFLLARLLREPRPLRLTGVDHSAEALTLADERLRREHPDARGRVTLVHASFTEPHPRFAGHDAAVLLEAIEHIDPDRLSAVERAVLGHARPRTVLLTTPNAEYNELLGRPPGRRRHPDHRFEWTRARFAPWVEGAARRNGYHVRLTGIGWPHPTIGCPTQMAELSRQDDRPA
jgi:small RNA 2'-O-methyltransferase